MLPAITITCKFSDAFLSHIPPEVNDVTNTRPDITTCITETGNILNLGYLGRLPVSAIEEYTMISVRSFLDYKGGGVEVEVQQTKD